MKTSIVLLTVLFPVIVFAEEVKLVWDMPSGAIDGFRVFQKTAYPQDSYNYDEPVKTKKYPDGNIPADVTEITIDLPGEPLKVLKYLFVCRAYKGSNESADSNEVGYKVVNTVPPVPVDLSAIYDDDAKTINLNWQQPQDGHIIYKWMIYYRLQGSNEYNDLGMVNYGQELALAAPFNVVGPGEKKTVYFTVVSFRRSGVYSGNAAEVELVIDRGEIHPVENLKIDIDIPVE